MHRRAQEKAATGRVAASQMMLFCASVLLSITTSTSAFVVPAKTTRGTAPSTTTTTSRVVLQQALHPHEESQARRRATIALFALQSSDWALETTSSPPVFFPLPFEPETTTPQQQQQQLPLWQLAAAGSLATFLGDACVHPVDCLKTLLQSSDPATASNMGQAAAHLWHTAGWAGFYHGFWTYAGTDAAGGALKFAVWELWKRQFQQQQHLLLLMLGAGLAFMASSLVIVPGELIKQNLQVEHYASLAQALDGIWTQDGLPGFYAGYDGVCFRELPYTMLELGLYEVFKSSNNQKTTTTTQQQQQTTTMQQQQQPSNAQQHHDSNSNNNNNDSSTTREIASAAATGAVAAVLTTPFDTIKTKLMVDAEYAHSSFVECWISTIGSGGGVAALFAGVEARVAWLVPFVCIYMPLYDAFKKRLVQRQQQEERLESQRRVVGGESSSW